MLWNLWSINWTWLFTIFQHIGSTAKNRKVSLISNLFCKQTPDVWTEKYENFVHNCRGGSYFPIDQIWIALGIGDDCETWHRRGDRIRSNEPLIAQYSIKRFSHTIWNYSAYTMCLNCYWNWIFHEWKLVFFFSVSKFLKVKLFRWNIYLYLLRINPFTVISILWIGNSFNLINFILFFDDNVAKKIPDGSYAHDHDSLMTLIALIDCLLLFYKTLIGLW